jgi:hypothetical protein
MRPKRSAKPKLGRLERIEPVDYWQSDADFVEWLREADNLELLGESLGLELTPMAAEAITEAPGYLLCEDSVTDSPVMVMPQVAPSDVAHLGQLMTWAAQVDAPRVVWVTAELLSDQVQTLSWLNQLGLGQVTLEGVEVELWRIGKNAMAANFHRVDCANDAPHGTAATDDKDLDENDADPSADTPAAKPEPLTEQQQENLDFWTGLCQQLDQRGSVIKPGAPTPETAMGFAIARADFRLYAILDRDHSCLHAELLLSGVDAHPHFYLLAHEQALVEAEMGYPLIWDDSGEQTCAIASSLSELDLADRKRWPDYQTWFCEHLEQLHEVFYNRIKHLDAATYQPLPNYGSESLANSFILPASGRS